MPGYCIRRLPVVVLVFAVATAAAAGEIYSTMRNVNAVVEAHGYRLNPASDVQPTALPSDLSPAQAFEIIRPMDKSVTIGRLFTSCSCIQLEAHKRTFLPGERAVLTLRNIRPTPVAGQVYAVFVQITHPVRTTLRYDTFVQSGSSGSGGPDVASGQPESSAPATIAAPPIGRHTGGPAALLDNELDRLADADDDEDKVAAQSKNGGLEIPGLTAPGDDDAQPSAPPSLDDLPQMANIPQTAQRTVGTADLAEGVEEIDEFSHLMADMLPNTDSAAVVAGQDALASEDLDLRLPEVDAVRDAIGAATEGMENLYEQVATNEDLAADVDAARQAMDNYFRHEADAAPGTDDLAVASGIGGDIPDFYAHVPSTPTAPVAASAQTAAAALPDDGMEDDAAERTVQRNEAPVADGGDVPALNPADIERVAPSAVEETLAGLDPTLGTRSAESASQTSAIPQRDPNARKPVQAVSLITVGVRDMQNSIRFYEALGWRRAAPTKYDQTAFFQLQGQILALYPMHDQLREQNMPEANPEPGGITLALHVGDKADVWAIYQRFIDAGGKALRPPAEMASGAVTSYVADPDGNPWEISWVPQFRIDDEGGLWLP